MAPSTQKRSRSTAVSFNHVEQASSFLADLPSRPKTDLSLREAMHLIQDSIRAALAKGYSYQELSEILGKHGIPISAFTLKNYVPSGKRLMSKTKSRKTKKAQESEAATPSAASVAESIEQSGTTQTPSQSSEPVSSKGSASTGRGEEISNAPESGRKTRSRVGASTKAGQTRKSGNAAKSRTTAKTQSSLKTTSTKDRKKT